MQVDVYDKRENHINTIEDVTRVWAPADGRHLVYHMVSCEQGNEATEMCWQVPAGYRIEVKEKTHPKEGELMSSEEMKDVTKPETVRHVADNQVVRIYPCDPTKNISCSKTSCYLKGDPCRCTLHSEFSEPKIKVKEVQFFFNSGLLDRIAKRTTDVSLTHKDMLKDVAVGDYLKYIGNHISCIVQVEEMSEPDCNANREVRIKLIKVVKGELDIEY
ncbi:MAG: hypothetical protein RR324_01115 [Cellulosilyticaceae bacterium]